MFDENLFELLGRGGFTMYPLLICSLLVWGVIFERLWVYKNLGKDLRDFHLEVVNSLLRRDFESVRRLCQDYQRLPTAKLVLHGMDRLNSTDEKVSAKWREALERQRQRLNLDLRRNLWVLGTIGSSAPFIGLFGTVVGILRSFHDISKAGSGGFAVVAAGISEALVATAVGIVVAVIAVMAFNAFQTKWGHLILMIRLNLEEMVEIIEMNAIEKKSVSSDGH